MHAGIKTRLEQLEKRAGIGDDPLTVIIVSFVEAVDGKAGEKAPLVGYAFAHYGEQVKEVMRDVGESEDDVLQRAKQSVAGMRPANGMIVLREIRRP